jgi:hypothetical protein
MGGICCIHDLMQAHPLRHRRWTQRSIGYIHLARAGDMLNGIEIRELASPYKFKQGPVLVWSFYGERMLEALIASMAH